MHHFPLMYRSCYIMFRALDKISSEEHSSLEIWDSPLFLSAVYQSKNHMIPNPGK